MGLLRRMKDMRDMMETAPGQLAQYQAQTPAAQGSPAGSADFAPVAGVSLEQFATIFKGAAALSHDDARLAEIAQSRGIDADRWELAAAAWNARIQSSPAVASRFSQLYREA
jgi:hypothetical protein